MMSLSEGLSQCTNLDLVVEGLSFGVGGYLATLRTKVFRVFGWDSKAKGF